MLALVEGVEPQGAPGAKQGGQRHLGETVKTKWAAGVLGRPRRCAAGLPRLSSPGAVPPPATGRSSPPAAPAEVLQRRAAAAADRLERDHPEAARVLAELPADVAGAVVAELNRRAFERAVQRAGEPGSGVAQLSVHPEGTRVRSTGQAGDRDGLGLGRTTVTRRDTQPTP